jgi:GT2 family glycosyltransferase
MPGPGKILRLFLEESASVALRHCASYLGYRLLGRRLLSIEDICYHEWRRQNAPSASALETMRKEAADCGHGPLISVIMPVYNTDAAMLRKAALSVERQVYPDWELCIADDCSTRADTRAELEALASRAGRVKVRFLPQNSGIAAASNAAIGLADGEFLALLDHDDELSPDALFEVAKLLGEYPDTDMIYSDEDKIDERGRRVEVFLKPDWSPELLLSNMYTCHLGVYRKTLVDEIGGFRTGFDGAQDYDLVLRLTERTRSIRHITKVLYHWRISSESTASSYSIRSETKSPEASSLKALGEALDRRRIEGTIEKGLFGGSFRVRPRIPPETLVSIVIPTKDRLEHLGRCIESIEQKTNCPDYEIIVIDNQSVEKETREYLRSLESSERRTRVIRYDKEFNFSAMNNFAAEDAKGDFLLFLNNDTEVIEPGWLEAMLELGRLPKVAIVGAKLLYPDDTVQHCGVVLWHCGAAGHLHSRLPRDAHGYFGMADAIRNCSAVSAACMMVKKKAFRELGGFDLSFRVSFQDVDFCLRALQADMRVAYTPFALLRHHESASTGKRLNEAEERLFTERWRERVPRDPFYNPNFPSDRLDFRIKSRRS